MLSSGSRLLFPLSIAGLAKVNATVSVSPPLSLSLGRFEPSTSKIPGRECAGVI